LASFGQPRAPATQEKIVIRFGLIGATALSLIVALANPAAAGDTQNGTTHVRKPHQRVAAAPPYVNGVGEPSLPVEQAIRFGYSQGYANYPSGWGGIYGDGRYPENTVTNPHYNTMH
jgi:hypothetical protein